MNSPLTFHFKDDGAVPNHPRWPTLVYKVALDLDESRDPEGEIETLFAANGWGHGQWRNGIFPFAHYHSKIHEALGIARGHATARFGGDKGECWSWRRATSPCCRPAPGINACRTIMAWLVIGAYPGAGTYNLCRGDNPADHGPALKTIPLVAKPSSDPVGGRDGALLALWRD